MREEQIIKIEYFGEDETYDLEVDSIEHIFYANDISVSNSHALSYSVLSYQCAWLLNYYPSEWCAAFLDKEPEDKKEKAINIVKSHGFKIKKVNINTSGGKTWEVDKNDTKLLIQPLNSIKGLGETTIDEITKYRPYNKIEDILFSDKIIRSKFGKKALDALIKSQSMNELVDNRFINLKHFWKVVVEDRPSSINKLLEKINLYKGTENFTNNEIIDFITILTGVFPIEKIVSEEFLNIMLHKKIPIISEYDKELKICWFILRSIDIKKTSKGNPHYILNVIDINNVTKQIKCWGVEHPKDYNWIHINHPYLCSLDYDEQFGFSIRDIRKKMKLLG